MYKYCKLLCSLHYHIVLIFIYYITIPFVSIALSSESSILLWLLIKYTNIWDALRNLIHIQFKKLENTDGGVTLLANNNTTSWVFFTFFELHNQIAQKHHIMGSSFRGAVLTGREDLIWDSPLIREKYNKYTSLNPFHMFRYREHCGNSLQQERIGPERVFSYVIVLAWNKSLSCNGIALKLLFEFVVSPFYESIVFECNLKKNFRLKQNMYLF